MKYFGMLQNKVHVVNDHTIPLRTEVEELKKSMSVDQLLQLDRLSGADNFIDQCVYYS